MSGPGGAGGQCDDGEESWDEDDDASSYRDDDSSSDGDDDGEELRSRPHHPQPQVHSTPAPVPSTSGVKLTKELEWDHSSM